MRIITTGVLALFFAMPLYSQGLTIAMKEMGPTGQTTATLQTDGTHARLDVPSMASQVLYDSSTKTLRLLVPLLKNYREYTPASIQERGAAAAGRGQPATAPITYKRTGTSKVRDWPCTTYDGFRGSEKVVEVCAAESAVVGLTSAEFTIVQQAIDMVKSVAPPELIDRIPTYGSVGNQGFAGFPVRRVTYRNGQPEFTAELSVILRVAVPAENFAVPAGFTKVP
jgi:Domain of unknown function (DUF4412)